MKAFDTPRTATLAKLIEREGPNGTGRIVGLSIEGDGVFIYTDSAKWCDDSGSGTFRGDSETAAVRRFRSEVQKAETFDAEPATVDASPVAPVVSKLDAIVARNTAFRSFAALVGELVYRPSLDMREHDMRTIADAYDKHMAKVGDARRAFRYGVNALQAGQRTKVFVNQGWRPARVLAVTEGRALVEYEMPAGGVHLWDVSDHTDLASKDGGVYGARNVSPARLPKRWRVALAQIAAETAPASEPAAATACPDCNGTGNAPADRPPGVPPLCGACKGGGATTPPAFDREPVAARFVRASLHVPGWAVASWREVAQGDAWQGTETRPGGPVRFPDGSMVTFMAPDGLPVEYVGG